MEELIFFAVIIFFSILESIARSRKAKKGGGVEAETGRSPEEPEWEVGLPDLDPEPSEVGRSRPRLSTYDEEPSYDETALRKGREDETMERYTRPSGTDRSETRAEPPGSSPRPSSETMLPGDLLAQLEGLARGRQAERSEARTLDLPDHAPPLPPLERTEVGTGRTASAPSDTRRPSPPVGTGRPIGSRKPIGSRETVASRPVAAPTEHIVHRSHAGYGTDPSTRAPSEQDFLGFHGDRPSAEALAVRRQLRAGHRSALRRAVILKEVLEPPVALRGERLPLESAIP